MDTRLPASDPNVDGPVFSMHYRLMEKSWPVAGSLMWGATAHDDARVNADGQLITAQSGRDGPFGASLVVQPDGKNPGRGDFATLGGQARAG